MSTAFTPGPWSINETGNVVSCAVHNVAIVFHSATKESWSGSDFATLSHCVANARLIASAPDLYALAASLAALADGLNNGNSSAEAAAARLAETARELVAGVQE